MGIYKKFKKETKRYYDEVTQSPTRALLAVGTGGGSEVFIKGGQQVSKDLGKMNGEPPELGGLPDMPTDTSAADQLAKDQALADAAETQAEGERKRRGRAATNLTSPQGLNSSNVSARRTLLGA